jgi:amino acid transporter
MLWLKQNDRKWGNRGKYMSITDKSTRAFTLSLVAGLLIVCNAVAVGVAGTYFPSIFPTLPGSDNNATVPFATIAVIALICGALVLIGAMMLRIKPENKKEWGILIAVFSIPSVITGGGFIIGFILGIVGGFSVLRKTYRPVENGK